VIASIRQLRNVAIDKIANVTPSRGEIKRALRRSHGTLSAS
jgi:hypothetical protein